MKRFFGLAVLLLLPGLIFAAGFAKQSLFLSKSPVTEGDSIRIYAVLSNSAATTFTGSVVVSDGSSEIGSVAVSIAAGGAQTASVPWQPTAGSHTVTAQLTGSDGTVVEKESESFTVDAKPLPIPAVQNAPTSTISVESSLAIQNQINSLSPAAAQVSQPLFSIIDGIRAGAANIIDSQLADAKAKLAPTSKSGVVAGASTSAGTDISGTAWTVFYTFYLYLLTVLRFLIGSAAVFYPLLAILFFYFLYRSYRWARRPAY